MLHIIFSTRLKDKKNEQYLSTKIIENYSKKEKKPRKHPSRVEELTNQETLHLRITRRTGSSSKVEKKARARSIFVTRIDFEYE